MRILWCHCVYIQNRNQNPNPKYEIYDIEKWHVNIHGTSWKLSSFSTKLDSYTVKHKKLFGDSIYPIEGMIANCLWTPKMVGLRAVGATKNKCFLHFLKFGISKDFCRTFTTDYHHQKVRRKPSNWIKIWSSISFKWLFQCELMAYCSQNNEKWWK